MATAFSCVSGWRHCRPNMAPTKCSTPTGTASRAVSRPQELLEYAGNPLHDPPAAGLVEGLLATCRVPFGAGGGRGRGRRGGGNAADGWQSLAEAIPQMPHTTLLIMVDGPLSGNNPLLRQLRQVCDTEEMTAPRGEQLARWIKQTAESRGAAIGPAAIRSLADLVAATFGPSIRNWKSFPSMPPGARSARATCG